MYPTPSRNSLQSLLLTTSQGRLQSAYLTRGRNSLRPTTPTLSRVSLELIFREGNDDLVHSAGMVVFFKNRFWTATNADRIYMSLSALRDIGAESPKNKT